MKSNKVKVDHVSASGKQMLIGLHLGNGYGSTTFNEPFNLARQFKALDIMSHGRAGWNPTTSSGEDVAANYGKRIPSSEDRYGSAYEVVQLIQALLGSK